MIYESAAAAAVAAGGGAAAVGTVGDRYLPQGAVEGRYGAFVGTGRRTDRDARPAGGGSHQQLVAACTFLHFEACWLDCAMHACASRATAGMADVRAEVRAESSFYECSPAPLYLSILSARLPSRCFLQ
jgi:hypothetical protein